MKYIVRYIIDIIYEKRKLSMDSVMRSRTKSRTERRFSARLFREIPYNRRLCRNWLAEYLFLLCSAFEGRFVFLSDRSGAFGQDTGDFAGQKLAAEGFERRLADREPGGKLLDKRAVFRKRRGHQDGLIVFTHNDAEFSGLRFCKAAEIQLRANVLRQRENQRASLPRWTIVLPA